MSPKKRILLVEDEASISVPLSFLLREEGFKVKVASDGEQALAAFRERTPDLILLDVMLPGLSGIEVCQRIRATSFVPIIMLTAKGTELDKVLGLEVGADDYVTKPYSSRELLARIKSVMRRAQARMEPTVVPRDETVTVGDVSLDHAEHRVLVRGQAIELPLKEFQLLGTLMANAGRVVPRAYLLAEVWGSDFFGDERTLDVHVKRLRGRLDPQNQAPSRIQTVRGVGYRFESDQL